MPILKLKTDKSFELWSFLMNIKMFQTYRSNNLNFNR